MKTIEFEMKYYPTHVNTSKNLITQSLLRCGPEDYNSIQFIPFVPAQVTGEQVYKQTNHQIKRISTQLNNHSCTQHRSRHNI